MTRRHSSDRYAADGTYEPGALTPGDDEYGPADSYEGPGIFPGPGGYPAGSNDSFPGYSAAAVRDAYARDAYAQAGGYAEDGYPAPADGYPDAADGNSPAGPFDSGPLPGGYADAEAGYAEPEPGGYEHGEDFYPGDQQYLPGYGDDDGEASPESYYEQNPFSWPRPGGELAGGERAEADDDPSGDPYAELGYARTMQPHSYEDDQAPADWDDSRESRDGEPPRRTVVPGFGQRDAPGRKRRRPGRVLAPVLAVVLLVVVGVGGFAAYKKIHLHSADYPGSGSGHITVQVRAGDTATSLAPRLVQMGVVASANSFVAAAKDSTSKATLEPGYFSLHKHMKAALAYQLLLNPSARVQTVVTIPEGLRETQILTLLQQKLGASMPANAFTTAAKNGAALGLPAFANGNPEGYLFPATYNIAPGTSATTVLKMMVARFDTEAQAINLQAAAVKGQMTPGSIITVASLLSAEGTPKYYAQIAEVIYNRLNMGMPLGLDSTVNYALHRFGVSLTESQLHVNSPYNTVIHTGLPPGPIDSPGDTAIQAALHPAHGDLLYFVTVNLKTGLTLFTDNAAQFQQDEALCVKNKAC